MNIFLLAQFYSPDVAPTSVPLHDLAQELAARGHRVLVFCGRHSYSGKGTFPSRENLDGVEVIRLPALGFPQRNHLARVANYGTFYTALLCRLLTSSVRPDLILSVTHPPYLGVLGRLVARFRGARHAHWIMDLYPDVMMAHGLISSKGWLGRILRGLTRAELRDAALVLTLGPYMARKIKPYQTREEPRWTPLWSDLRLSPWEAGRPIPLRGRRGWNDGECVLLYAGNMGLGHRFGEFLAAAERLGKEGPRWVFSGGGARRREIEAFARAHPGARVELQPYVGWDQLREHLASVDVHLLSLDSSWQGLIVPSKLAAAFAVGKPVIFVGASENELAQWVLESGGGWAVAEGDVEGLLAAVASGCDPAERARRGAAGYVFWQRHFQRRANCGQIAEWLEQSRRP